MKPQPGSDLERALALRDVMDHAVKVQREITAPKRVGESRARLAVLLVLCVVLLGAAGYSWFARPEFIWGPRVQVSPLRREADVRFAMFLLAQRLDAQRAADGALPKTLAAIGEGASGIGYRVLSDSAFELTADLAGRNIVLRSTDSRERFLGNSIAVISGHTQ